MSGAAIVLVLVAALLPGCAGDAATPRAAASSAAAAPLAHPAYRRVYRSGPVTVTVQLDRQKTDLSGKVTLEDEIVWEPGFRAELLEDLTADYDGLGVVATSRVRLPRDAAPRVQAGAFARDPASVPARGVRLQRTLEPDRTGAVRVRSRVVVFSREGERSESEIELAPIAIEVRPVPADLDRTPPAPRPIFALVPGGGTVAQGRTRLVAAAVGGALLLGTLLLFWWRWRRPRARPEPADALALRALSELERRGWIERGEAGRFFVALAQVLRVYLDRGFAVRAPERTTEELLHTLRRHPRLLRYRDDLAGFLQLADRVKFAGEATGDAEMTSGLRCVRGFVEATATASGEEG